MESYKIIEISPLNMVEYMKSLEGTFDFDVDLLIPQIEAVINMALDKGESLPYIESFKED